MHTSILYFITASSTEGSAHFHFSTAQSSQHYTAMMSTDTPQCSGSCFIQGSDVLNMANLVDT
eukprot:scaffold219297_cov22-Tisochrysis_lutea.AAC.3